PEIEDEDFGGEVIELPAGLAPARGEGHIVPPGEKTLVGAPQGGFVLDEQHLAPRAGGGGRHWWANIWRSPTTATGGSAGAGLQLEEVVELGQHQQEAQLFVGSAQAHRQPAF